MSHTETDGVSELFNYNEEKNKGDLQDGDELLPKVIQHRVFINHVDAFQTKHIASFLTDQLYGALKAGAGGEGEEGEENQDQKAEAFATQFTSRYEIIGTLKADFHKKTEDIAYTVDENSEKFLNEIMKCGFVIYNITQDPHEIPKALSTLSKIEQEIDKLQTVGPKTFSSYSQTRVFVLLSTVMTWGLTKPIDPEEPATPFNESDYKKRRPHPNYKEHIACEREVVLKGRKYKDKLKTYVICSGLTYGEEEEDLSIFFKMAWKNKQYLPVFLPGKNFVPLIHIQDLCRVIHGVLETTPSKPQFILAVEQTPCTLRQIMKALCKIMGRGKLKDLPKEEAFLCEDVTQTLYDQCTVNLNMEPGFIVDDLELEWKNELNLAENMANIVAEFRKSRNLKPLRVIVHGPPAVGKSKLAAKLCENYGTQHVTVARMIEETLQDLRDQIETEKDRLKEKEEKARLAQVNEQEMGEEEAEEEEEEEVDLEDLEEQIRDIQSTMTNSENEKLPDDYVIRLMKKHLMNNRCQNQGYVLDGYPKTMQQVKELFGAASEEGDEEAGEEEEGDGDGSPLKILPDYVISLQATDQFLCERVMAQPEKDIQDTHYTEKHMLRRLEEFRFSNTEDNTMLNFFNEIEIHPIMIDIMEQPTEDMDNILKSCMDKLGPVIGFGLTLEEEAKMHECMEEERRLQAEEERLQIEVVEQKAIECHEKKMEDWAELLEKMQKEEEKLIVAESEPLRNYLMRYVFPTLTKGLIEVAKIKPCDPVDFLAEYLFKENPEGHMFDPSYTREGEFIAEQEKVLEAEEQESTIAQ